MSDERTLILAEAKKIGRALAETLAPMWEVVVHDLTRPDHSIIFIGNNLSDRAVGDPATELGLARIEDSEFPDVLANYANVFADGRPAKSTSIGLRDKSGKFVAAICLNMDLSYLQGMEVYLRSITEIAGPATREEILGRRVRVEDKILRFAASRNRDPRSLGSEEKRELIQTLEAEGEFQIRGAAERIAAAMGVSRTNLYYYLGNGTSSAQSAMPGPSQAEEVK
jgi:predicted transcriptional regulator YheO